MPNVILSGTKCREESHIKYMNESFLYLEITNVVLKFVTKKYNYEILPSSE